MNFSICVFSSGSKGNCTFITDGKTKLLIDAGISCKRIESSLQDIGESIENIDGILITHEHIDHIRGLKTLSKRMDIPVVSNYKTLNAIDTRLSIYTKKHRREDFDSGFYINNIFVQPFRIMHDAVSPVGYTLCKGQSKVSSITDLGCISPNIINCIKGSDVVILESNHDEKMLQSSSYPERLKRRIEGKYGHLSNKMAALFAKELVESGAKQIILAHLSEENNIPELAFKTACSSIAQLGAVIEKDVFVDVAHQNSRTKLYIC